MINLPAHLEHESSHIQGINHLVIISASLVAQTVKNLPAMQETWIQSLGQEDPLENGTATRSDIFWRLPWTEEPGGLQSVGSHRVRHDWAANTLSCRLDYQINCQSVSVTVLLWNWPLFYPIMAPQHMSSDAGNLDNPKRSYVLP